MEERIVLTLRLTQHKCWILKGIPAQQPPNPYVVTPKYHTTQILGLSIGVNP